MPKRKKRAARYIRESDPTLVDSNTIDSQAKYVLDHCLKQGYDCDPRHEYREALSAYNVPYMERVRLLAMLEAAKRKEFDVLVVSEIRALARRQVEVFVIYDILQKYGVELETVQERFEDSAMGRLVLSLRAAFSEIEREQIYLRLQRGKKDRMELGKAIVNGRRAYGFILLDTEKEVKARYELNHEILYVDYDGKQWSEYMVRKHILEQLARGVTIHAVTRWLNDMGIPPPHKPRKGIPSWAPQTVYRIAISPMNIGQVWGNRYKKVGKAMVERSPEEWIRLPDAPAIIDEETYFFILKQIKYNKQDSLRNNKHTDELGLVRSGYIFCGICGHSMILKYPTEAKRILKHQHPYYSCQQLVGRLGDIIHRHQTHISANTIDTEVRHLTDPSYVEAVSYDELRMAVRILGIRCTVYPTQGGWPYRYQIEVTVPEIMKKLKGVSQSTP